MVVEGSHVPYKLGTSSLSSFQNQGLQLQTWHSASYLIHSPVSVWSLSPNLYELNRGLAIGNSVRMSVRQIMVAGNVISGLSIDIPL